MYSLEAARLFFHATRIKAESLGCTSSGKESWKVESQKVFEIFPDVNRCC